MPARGRGIVYSPGKGTTVSGPKGAKTFVGKGPGPAGTKKLPERSYSEVPTTTVSPTGQVTTSGFSSPSKAQRQAARTRRAQAILRPTFKAPPKPKTPVLNKARAYKPTGVSATPSIKAASRKAAQEFKLEGPKPPVVVKAHTRAAPKATERRVALHNLQTAKKAVAKTRKGAELRSPIVQTPEQSKVAKTLLRVGRKVGANRKEKLAALDTGLQESGMKNLPVSGPGGGWRQEESAFYPAKDITNVAKGARNFYAEAKSDTGGARGKGETVPHLSQSVQASGAGESYYVDNVPEAQSLLRQYNQGKANPKALKNLKEAKLAAKELGLKVGQSPGKPSKQVVTRYQAGLKAAETLAHSHIPYVWGGGHGSIEGAPTGLDCSGAVSWVLNKMGVLKTPLPSGSMGSVLKPGPGAVTVFYNAGHTFMKIGEKYFGTSVNDSSKGLAFYKNPGASYLSQYNVGHVPGLGKKEAIQLGFKLPSGGNPESFPGMSVSGNTATISEGTTQAKPGFSNKPIRLTPQQKFKQLEQLGVGVSPGKSDKGPSTATLEALDKKYQAA